MNVGKNLNGKNIIGPYQNFIAPKQPEILLSFMQERNQILVSLQNTDSCNCTDIVLKSVFHLATQLFAITIRNVGSHSTCSQRTFLANQISENLFSLLLARTNGKPA